MATVLLAGAFGQRNPGYEALLRAFCDELVDHRVIATSADPDDPTTLFYLNGSC